MAIMNMEEPNAPAMDMEQGTPEDTNMGIGSPNPYMDDEDDGVDDDEYEADIVENLENHLNTLPDEGKALLKEVVAIPKFVAAITLINGQEVGKYFEQFIDPELDFQVVRKPIQKPNTQPQIQPQMQAPAGGGIMNVGTPPAQNQPMM